MKKKFILIPDVHGRTFWKDILPFVYECERIIFLGDYHDPYDREGILPFQSLENFKEILEFAKTHMDKVTLLLGNHDLTYYSRSGSVNWSVGANRIDYTNYAEMCRLFRENCELFNLLTVINMTDENRVFLLSHAGVHPQWITENKLVNNYNQTDTSAETIWMYIDNLFRLGDSKLMSALGNVGYYRGGNSDTGSMVWADCDEFVFSQHTPYTQIFGHTQQWIREEKEDGTAQYVPGKPFIVGENVCIDCHKCFYIDEEGTIRDLNTDEEIY